MWTCLEKVKKHHERNQLRELGENRMNVLILADYRAPKSGNFAASILELGMVLREQNSTAVYMFPENHQGGYSWSRWIESNGFKVILFDEKQPEDTKLAHIKHVIDEYGINIVHSHFGYLHGLLLVNHRAIGKNVKLIFHDHMDFNEVSSIRKQKLATLKWAAVYRIFDAYVISVMAKKDRAYWLAGRKRHWYIENGLSLMRAEQDLRTSEEIRTEIGVMPDEKLVLFLGWDLHRKGLDIAIKGVSEYRKTNPKVKLGVIGAGRGAPSDNTEHFLKQAGCNPNEDWILYLNDYEDMFALNRAADIYISASRAEAFSYGLLEAISQNNPVVASDIEGTSWSWEYSKCTVFRNEDALDCANALKKAIEMGDIESNYQSIAKQYGVDVWCKKIISVYHQLT